MKYFSSSKQKCLLLFILLTKLSQQTCFISEKCETCCSPPGGPLTCSTPKCKEPLFLNFKTCQCECDLSYRCPRRKKLVMEEIKCSCECRRRKKKCRRNRVWNSEKCKCSCPNKCSVEEFRNPFNCKCRKKKKIRFPKFSDFDFDDY